MGIHASICFVDHTHMTGDFVRSGTAGRMNDRNRARRHIEQWNSMYQRGRDSPYDIVASISRIAENAKSAQLFLIGEVVPQLRWRLLHMQVDPRRIVDESGESPVPTVRAPGKDRIHSAAQTAQTTGLSLTNHSCRHSRRHELPVVDDVMHSSIMSRRSQRTPDGPAYLWKGCLHPQPFRARVGEPSTGCRVYAEDFTSCRSHLVHSPIIFGAPGQFTDCSSASHVIWRLVHQPNPRSQSPSGAAVPCRTPPHSPKAR